MHLFSLSLSRVTIPTHPTIVLFLSLYLLQRFSKLCLTLISSNISNPTTFFQITSMTSVRRDLHGILFLFFFTHDWSSSLRNFGESFVIDLDISKAFDGVRHKALLAKLPTYSFTPSLGKLISNFHPLTLYLLLTTQPLHPSRSSVMFLSVPSFHLPFLLFVNDLHISASDVHFFADDSTLHRTSSFQCQSSSNDRSQSRLAMSSPLIQICRAFQSGNP